MNIATISLETIAFIGFLLATILAFLRYNKTREVTNIWFLFTSSFLVFTIAVIVRIIEEVPDFQIFGYLESILLLIGATLLFSAQALYQKEKILCKDCYDGNIKKRDGKRYKKIEEWQKTM